MVFGASFRFGLFLSAFLVFVFFLASRLFSLPCAFFSVFLVARFPVLRSPLSFCFARLFLLFSLWRPVRCAVFAGALRFPRFRWFARFLFLLFLLLSGGVSVSRFVVVFSVWVLVAFFARVFALFSVFPSLFFALCFFFARSVFFFFFPLVWPVFLPFLRLLCLGSSAFSPPGLRGSPVFSVCVCFFFCLSLLRVCVFCSPRAAVFLRCGSALFLFFCLSVWALVVSVSFRRLSFFVFLVSCVFSFFFSLFFSLCFFLFFCCVCSWLCLFAGGWPFSCLSFGFWFLLAVSLSCGGRVCFVWVSACWWGFSSGFGCFFRFSSLVLCGGPSGLLPSVVPCWVLLVGGVSALLGVVPLLVCVVVLPLWFCVSVLSPSGGCCGVFCSLGACLLLPCRVFVVGLRVVLFFLRGGWVFCFFLCSLSFPAVVAPAFSVPAAAVFRWVLAFFGFSGRFALAGGLFCLLCFPRALPGFCFCFWLACVSLWGVVFLVLRCFALCSGGFPVALAAPWSLSVALVRLRGVLSGFVSLVVLAVFVVVLVVVPLWRGFRCFRVLSSAWGVRPLGFFSFVLSGARSCGGACGFFRCFALFLSWSCLPRLFSVLCLCLRVPCVWCCLAVVCSCCVLLGFVPLRALPFSFVACGPAGFSLVSACVFLVVGGVVVLSSWPFRPGLLSCFFGAFFVLRPRVCLRSSFCASLSGLVSASRLLVVGFACFRGSVCLGVFVPGPCSLRPSLLGCGLLLLLVAFPSGGRFPLCVSCLGCCRFLVSVGVPAVGSPPFLFVAFFAVLSLFVCCFVFCLAFSRWVCGCCVFGRSLSFFVCSPFSF
ncbi:flavodoxin domain-containing protein, partial [Escherichia coli]|uniref:flavodoxin domain-containing protein n=1 Tax=Escherichia coli TaxID=562 RepID=UPI0035CB7568